MTIICNKKAKLIAILLLIPLHGNTQSFDELNNSLWESWFSGILQLSWQNIYTDSQAHVLEAIGGAYFDLEKYDSSVYFLNLAISKDSLGVTANAYLNSASVKIIKGKWKEGLTDMNKVIRLSQYDKKEIIRSLFEERIAELYLHHNEFDSAIHYFSAVLQNNSPDISEKASYYLAWAFLKTGNTDKAMQCFALINTVRQPRTQYGFIYQELAKYAFDSVNAKESYRYEKFWPNETRWVMVEDSKMVYFFKDTIGWGKDSIDAYVNRSNKESDTFDAIYHAILPKKLTTYIYDSSNEIRYSKMGKSTEYLACISYTTRHDAFNAWGLKAWGTSCISYKDLWGMKLESLMAAFGLDARYTVIKSTNSKIHFFDKVDYYPYYSMLPIMIDDNFNRIAGEFIHFLSSNSTAEQFDHLIRNPTKENAEKIYGTKKVTDIADEYDGIMRKKIDAMGN